MLEAALPSLESIREPVADRLIAVEKDLAGMVEADFGPVNEVSSYVMASAGKLLRPTLLLLCNDIGGRPSPSAVRLGAIVELMHIATLVHDDSVDHSPSRRGMPTVNEVWSHQVAVIMGDYLYSRALVEITRLGDIDAIELLATASNRMSIGEMRQLAAHDALEATEADYRDLCECKTASLISAACELGALFGQPEHRTALSRFGHYLGMSFQIIDDLLDYTASQALSGKPRGLDIREHKVTLPLIVALPRMSKADREVVEGVFASASPSDDRVEQVMSIVTDVGGVEETRKRAREFADLARGQLGPLPPEPGVRLLDLSIDFVLERQG